jgi:hypothetical protein
MTTTDNNRQQQTTTDNNRQQQTTTDNNRQQQTILGLQFHDVAKLVGVSPSETWI